MEVLDDNRLATVGTMQPRFSPMGRFVGPFAAGGVVDAAAVVGHAGLPPALIVGVGAGLSLSAFSRRSRSVAAP